MFGDYTWLVLTVIVVALAAIVIGNVHRRVSSAREAEQAEQPAEELPRIPSSERADDALYQFSRFFGERLVARAVSVEIDERAKRIHFEELNRSDRLLLPEECDFRKYRIMIDAVGDAVKIDHEEPEKGRVLRDVTANILGYVEH